MNVPVDIEKVQGYQRAWPLIGEARESSDRDPRVRLTLWSAEERAARESDRDVVLREEKVKVEMRLGSLNLRFGGGNISVVKESGEEGACWYCRLDGFSGGRLVDSSLAWCPLEVIYMTTQ